MDQPPIEPDSLRDLLKCWHNSARLAHCRLSGLDLFRSDPQVKPGSADAVHAAVIRSVMLDVIEKTLQRIPISKQTGLSQGILYAFYIEELTTPVLCQRASLSEATLFRRMQYELGVACEVLTLMTVDAQAFNDAGEQFRRRVVSFNVPAEPDEYVHRHALLKASLNLLASPNNSNLALVGSAGAGKSMLAAAITRHKEIEEMFPDGVLWADLGQEGNPNRCLTEWLEVITGGQAIVSTDNTHDLFSRLRAYLTDKKMLVVIDDVWNMEAAESLLVGGSGSRHIITTRSPAHAYSLASNNVITVDDLTFEEARVLMDKHLPYHLNSDQNIAAAILNEVNNLIYGDHANRLVLAVHIAASRLRYFIKTGQSWRISDLPSGDSLLDTRIAQSLSALKETELEALINLSVLPAKPNTFNDAQACAIASCSLATVGCLIDAGLISPWRGRLTIHKSIWQYLRKHQNSSRPGAAHRLISYFCKQPANTNRLNLLDLDNVKAALTYSENMATVSERVTLLKSCYWLMEYAGDNHASGQAIDRLLSHDCSISERVALQARRARLQWLGGNDDDAIANLRQLGSEAVRFNDPETAALCTQTLSNIHFSRHEVDEWLELIADVPKGDLPGVNEGTLLQAETLDIRHLLVKTRLDELKIIMVKAIARAPKFKIFSDQVAIGQTVVAWLDYLDGKVAQAREQLVNMQSLSQERGYRTSLIIANGALSRVKLFDGDLTNAVAYANFVIRHENRNASPDFTALSYETLGLASQIRGDATHAKQYFEAGIEYARQNKSVLIDAALHASLSGLYLYCGDAANAGKAASVAIHIASQTRNNLLQSTALILAAAAAGLGGNQKEAQRLFAQAKSVGKFDAISGKTTSWCEALYLIHYGEHMALTEQWDSAISVFECAIKQYTYLESPERAGIARYGLARARLAVGDFQHAAVDGQASLEALKRVGSMVAMDVEAWLYRNHLVVRSQLVPHERVLSIDDFSH